MGIETCVFLVVASFCFALLLSVLASWVFSRAQSIIPFKLFT